MTNDEGKTSCSFRHLVFVIGNSLVIGGSLVGHSSFASIQVRSHFWVLSLTIFPTSPPRVLKSLMIPVCAALRHWQVTSDVVFPTV
jgi:hypothetical protein